MSNCRKAFNDFTLTAFFKDFSLIALGTVPKVQRVSWRTHMFLYKRVAGRLDALAGYVQNLCTPRIVLYFVHSPFNTSIQGFVITVTMIREAIDDFYRFLRDREMNRKKYGKLTAGGKVTVPSSDINVGDLIIVQKVKLYDGLKHHTVSS